MIHGLEQGRNRSSTLIQRYGQQHTSARILRAAVGLPVDLPQPVSADADGGAFLGPLRGSPHPTRCWTSHMTSRPEQEPPWQAYPPLHPPKGTEPSAPASDNGEMSNQWPYSGGLSGSSLGLKVISRTRTGW